MTESELKSAVIDLATMLKWKVHHDRPSQNSRGDWSTAIEGHKGFPDLCMARTGRVIFAELKVKSRKLTDSQAEWFAELQGGPHEVYLWTDVDWLDGTIQNVLRGKN